VAAAAAAHYVFSGPKDGHRWLGASGTLESLAVRGAHPTTHKDWHYFLLSASPSVFTVPVDSPYQTFDEVLAFVRENPGKMKVSPISAGAPPHILMEALRSTGDFDYNFIPYDGSYPTMVAAVAGEVEAAVIPVAEASGYIRDGRLRPLVMLEDQPYDILGTEVPAITDWVPELGRYLPMPNWFGFMVPAGTPDDVLEKIDVAFQNILGRPEIKEYLANTNTDLLGLTGEAADEMAARQERVHSWILYDLGLVTISPEDFGIERP
jgi:tripartite-type tricarboxylate transporter receptor subunit TctC